MLGQHAGAIITYLRRYALATLAGVATDDDDAGESSTDASADDEHHDCVGDEWGDDAGNPDQHPHQV